MIPQQFTCPPWFPPINKRLYGTHVTIGTTLGFVLLPFGAHGHPVLLPSHNLDDGGHAMIVDVSPSRCIFGGSGSPYHVVAGKVDVHHAREVPCFLPGLFVGG